VIIFNKEQVAKEVSQIMHRFSKGSVEGFFRRTLENVQRAEDLERKRKRIVKKKTER